MPNQALSHFLLYFVGRSVLLLFVYQKEINADGRAGAARGAGRSFAFCFRAPPPYHPYPYPPHLHSLHACDCANRTCINHTRRHLPICNGSRRNSRRRIGGMVAWRYRRWSRPWRRGARREIFFCENIQFRFRDFHFFFFHLAWATAKQREIMRDQQFFEPRRAEGE